MPSEVTPGGTVVANATCVRAEQNDASRSVGWFAPLLVLVLASLQVPLVAAEPPATTTPAKAPRRLGPIAAEDPLIVHTLYTWYTRDSFGRAAVQPLEPFSSDDTEHYRTYFPYLRANGVDVIAGVLTGLPGERRADGSPLPTSFQAENLLKIVPLVGSAGMKFFIYTTTRRSGPTGRPA